MFFSIEFLFYEDDWTSDVDERSINLKFQDGGMLEFKSKDWDYGGSSNLLNVSEDAITWVNEPRWQGKYKNKEIQWNNGTVWKKKGSTAILYLPFSKHIIGLTTSGVCSVLI